MYDEDRLEEELASRPMLGGLWHPDGWSAPPEQAPPVKVPPPIVYLDPRNILEDALRRLYTVACEVPDLCRYAEGTLDEAKDALEIAAKARAAR